MIRPLALLLALTACGGGEPAEPGEIADSPAVLVAMQEGSLAVAAAEVAPVAEVAVVEVRSCNAWSWRLDPVPPQDDLYFMGYRECTQ